VDRESIPRACIQCGVYSIHRLHYTFRSVNLIKIWRKCARVSVDKDGGTGNASAGGGNNCEFKMLVTAVPYGSVSNSSTSVRTAAVPAHA